MKLLLVSIACFIFTHLAYSEPICEEYLVPLSGIGIGEYKEFGTMQPLIKVGVYYRSNEDIKFLSRNGSSRNLDLSNRPPFFQSFILPPPDNLDWVKSDLRSEAQDYFIFLPHGEVLEKNKWCGVIHHPKVKPNDFVEPNFYEFLGDEWPGGFVNTCYGIGYNYAGKPIYSVSYNDNKLKNAARKFLVTPWHERIDNKVIVVICKEPNKSVQPTANASAE